MTLTSAYSQRTLERFNRMELLLRQAGIKTEYGFTDDKLVLTWERARYGFSVEYGHLFAVTSMRTGNLRFCGGTVSAYSSTETIKTYREAWNAVSLAVELANRAGEVTA